ncbi:MAG TPA: FtsX-like permease family protein [Solirubrobacteraceae bacterium]|nr:FtsX-like permease family protein [Solirubrobacteraceae bacterium]
MGTALLVFRLAARDVRRHAAQAILLVVAIAAATATLTMAIALNGVTSRSPYLTTRAATKGPDVVAYMTSAAQASNLSHASGVANHSGPFPVASATIHFDGRQADVFAEGRTEAPSAVDQPLLTAGSWVRPGGVVIERTFADALGVSVGDRVSLDGKSFVVAGIAVTAAQSPYPNLCNGTLVGPTPTASKFSNACPTWFNIPFLSLRDGQKLASSDEVGQIWMTEPDATALTSTANPLTTYAVNLKLANPNDAQAFAYDRFARTDSATAPVFSTWQGLASEDGKLIQDGQGVLEPGAFLLALLAIASVAVLVGRRLSEYARRVGLLKAVGGTPSVVAATFLAENLVLALFAAVVGLAAGWLAAPLITKPGAALIGTAGAAPLSLGTVVQVIGLAIVVSLAATLVPAIRASRGSTVAALNDVGRPPKRRGALVRISSRLPIPALFGLRLVARRPRRSLLSAANVAVTTTGIVAVIAFHAFADNTLSGAVALTGGGLSNPVVNRDEQMLTIITIMLVALAALNTLFTTWATVLDARHAAALMQALGARSRQVSSGLVVAQVLCALPGAIVGIPLGIGLFEVAVKHGTLPPVTWLVAAAIGTLVAMAALTIVPARIGARQPIAEVLSAEAA